MTVSPKKLNINEHTKADLIRNVVRSNPNMTRREAEEFYGQEDLFSQGQFYTIRAQVQEALKAEKKEKKAKTHNDSSDTKQKGPQAFSAPASEVAQLRDENNYLRWLILGERRGYLERWLAENEDG